MEEKFSFFKGINKGIRDILDVLAEAYKYAELDFYKLKSEVLTLVQRANAKGYDSPDYGSLSIQVKSRFETAVVVELYYKKNGGKFQRFKKSLDIGVLTNVPYTVKRRLNSTGEVTIKLSDFEGMKSVSERDIEPKVEFKHLYAFKLKNSTKVPLGKELHITDELFYYKVVLVYIYDNGERNMKVKYFGYIDGLPNEVVEKIESSEDRSCYMDVTQ